jgi:TRAP-type transport system small permease protein
VNRLVSRIEFYVGMALLAIITVLVFIAAVMRFLGHPLIWSVDMAQLLLIWLCFIGAAQAMRKRGHIGVDFLVRWFPHRVRLWIETLLAVVFIFFLLVLAWEGYGLTRLNWERIFGDSGLPYAWVTIAVPAGSLMLIFAILANLAEAWTSRRDGALVFTGTATEEA